MELQAKYIFRSDFEIRNCDSPFGSLFGRRVEKIVVDLIIVEMKINMIYHAVDRIVPASTHRWKYVTPCVEPGLEQSLSS